MEDLVMHLAGQKASWFTSIWSEVHSSWASAMTCFFKYGVS